MTKKKRLSLSTKLLGGFFLGAVIGYLAFSSGLSKTDTFQSIVAPILELVGDLFVSALKAIVVPIVFFSLFSGAAKMPLRQSGKLGVGLMGLYLFTSFIATVVGLGVAFIFAPGQELLSSMVDLGSGLGVVKPNSATLKDTLLNIFDNPFHALANNNFLGFIAFSLALGFALSYLKEKLTDANMQTPVHCEVQKSLQVLEHCFQGITECLMVIVRWVMELAPPAIFALSMLNFAKYGHTIIGPYLKTIIGIIIAVVVMIFAVYGSIVYLFKKQSILFFIKAIKNPMITAFATRSSAASLPVSIEAAQKNLNVPSSFANFSLPIGATVNMDGVCVHLPMFSILAANIFGIDVAFSDLLLLTLTTVLAAIGAGGIPGGSLMLLFMTLTGLGLNNEQISLVVSIALGVNPILDMFETMNNVVGDLACTYALSPTRESDISSV